MLRFVPQFTKHKSTVKQRYDAFEIRDKWANEWFLKIEMNAAADYPISLFIYSVSDLFDYVSLTMHVFDDF